MLQVLAYTGLLVAGFLALGNIPGGSDTDAIVHLGITALCWWLAVLAGRVRTPPPAPPAPEVVHVVDYGVRTDGYAGAFSRLDPAQRAWLAEEAQARETRG